MKLVSIIVTLKVEGVGGWGREAERVANTQSVSHGDCQVQISRTK